MRRSVDDLKKKALNTGYSYIRRLEWSMALLVRDA
jgi:hypothetical protein